MNKISPGCKFNIKFAKQTRRGKIARTLCTYDLLTQKEGNLGVSLVRAAVDTLFTRQEAALEV